MPTAFTIKRMPLAAGVDTAIFPPYPCSAVTVGNATPDDLRVYTTLGDDTTYLGIASGYPYTFTLTLFKNQLYGPGDYSSPAFWLRALQAGTIVLTWL